MQLLQDGVIALLAAIGLTALLWSLAANALEKVQNEPHMANPIFAPLRGDMLSVKMFTSL